MSYSGPGEAMKRRSKAGGKAGKSARRKASTPKLRRTPPKAVFGRGSATITHETDITRLTRERDELLEQQAATSNVLQVISSSLGELEPVFAAILASATRICEAKFGNLFLREGEAFRAVAWHGERTYVENWRGEALIIKTDGPDIPLARLAATKQRIHIADLRQDAAYKAGFAQIVTMIDKGGARTLLIVPMLKEHTLVGAIALYRQEVRPFTGKQIALVENFAAQAVIAIENARLLNELRRRTDDLSQRTTDLTEALEQQTATSVVLEVISRSAFDLQAVFETVAESSVRLCGADRAFIFRFDGELLRMVVGYNSTPAFVEWVAKNPIRPGRHSGSARAALERRTIHITDVLADPEYVYGAKDVEPIRTVLGVPILKGDDLLGVMMIYRLEVRPFTDRQIALVETFADQAAIAIENVRLFDAEQQRSRELAESLEQQTATSEVFQVIASSPGDLQPVFETMLEKAVRICAAKFGSLYLHAQGSLWLVAGHDVPEFLEARRGIAFEPAPGALLDQVMTSKRTGQIADLAVTKAYVERHPRAVEAVELGGIRSAMAVPMLKDDDLIGIIAIHRREVLPFTDKQIELLTNFAAQAVIAIENARLLNELRQRTDDLTRSLEDLRTTQDRLVQTQKLASLGQLTAGIAHEIKNPLNFVNNFSGVSVELIDELQEALQRVQADDGTRSDIGELAGTLRDNLGKIVQHGRRADAILKNMLLHSREGSGEHRPVDINAIVEEALNLAYHGARAEKQDFTITLQRSFDPEAGQADVFPQDITRVLLNLISNGFYAAIKRKGTIDSEGFEPTVAAITRSLGDRVEIGIRDNGTGITPEVKEKMFNPFFTTKPAGEGTGLGLSISYDIVVKQHAGSIEVDTQPGEFTEIRIVLPRSAAHLLREPA
jgi:GAF domain-containing protein